MGMDSLSPVAPARVRCLLLPYGRITRIRFMEFVEKLRPAVTVRLGDISPNEGSDRNMFSPLAFPNGSLVYDFTTSSTTVSHRSLVPFELYRETLVVIAIADGLRYPGYGAIGSSKETGFGVDELSDAENVLRDDHPSAFVHRMFIFDFDSEVITLPDGLIPIPPEPKLKPTTIKTVICDLTSVLLAEMTTFARSVQALPNLEIPKLHKTDGLNRLSSNRRDSRDQDNSRPGSPSSTTTDSGAQSPVPDFDKHSHRASLPAHLNSSLGSRLGNEPGRSRSAAEGTRTPPVTFDDMSDLPERPGTTPSAELPVRAARDRVSVHGFGPASVGERARNQAKSRIGVVVGSMYLLAGRWSDALRELSESASAAKANSDYAWHAKALDYLLVTLLMYAWAGLDFEIPQVLHPFGDKSSVLVSKPVKQLPNNSIGLGQSAETASTSTPVAVRDLCSVLPDVANNILNLYGRATQFGSSPVPQVIFSDTTVRLAKLLSLLHNSSVSLSKHGLQSVVLNDPTSPIFNGESRVLDPTKAEVSALLYRAFPVSSTEEPVDLLDRLNILAGMASVLSSLGLHRKKAFILREFLSLLLPALVQSRKQNAAEQGVHPAASLSTADLAINEAGVSDVLGKHHGVDHGLQQFLTLICEVYGIVLASSEFVADVTVASDNPESFKENTGDIGNRAVYHALKRSFGNPILKLDILRTCINICEAVPDLRGMLKFSSDLLNTAGSGIAPGPGTTDSSPTLPVEHQSRLSNNISRTIGAAKQLGFNSLEAEYWDEFLVRDVDVINHSSSNPPLARRKAELTLASVDSDQKEGPFIYNPFAKPGTAIKETILIAEEEVTFTILVQNLYDFELEIEWIKFDVPETLLRAEAYNVVIGPYRTHNIHIVAVPKSSGQLKIDACVGKVKGCRARRFPVFKNQWRLKQEVKVKRHGLAASKVPKDRPVSFSSEVDSVKWTNPTGLPVASWFEAKVIKPQPTLVLKSMSLPQSAIMVLEGETRRFTLTLQNTSDTFVDLLLLSFSDSSSEELKKSLDSYDLSPAEVYEAELAAYQKSALRILPHNQGKDLKVSPGESLVIDIELYGKPGLSHANVLAEYSFLGVPRSELEDRFYTRQLTIPFSITVSASAYLIHNDFLPFTRDFVCNERSLYRIKDFSSRTEHDFQGPKQSFLNLLSLISSGSHSEDHCLVILDFINSWSRPLILSLHTRPHLSEASKAQELQEDVHTVRESLQPGHTSRILTLLPRLAVTHPHTPIPSLRNKRQFVVSTSKISPDFERLSRELFWHREDVIQHIGASWTDPKSGRSGEIDLRRMILTPRMLEALKVNDIGIEMALSSKSIDTTNGSGVYRQLSRAHYSIATSSFINLTTTLTSRLSHPIYPLLRLQPALRNQPYNVALDLSKKLAYNGVLQHPLQILHPGEKREVDLGVIFLAAGEYEFGACVEEVRVFKDQKVSIDSRNRHRSGTGELQPEDLTRTDRRTWFAKEACWVDVVQKDNDS